MRSFQASAVPILWAVSQRTSAADEIGPRRVERLRGEPADRDAADDGRAEAGGVDQRGEVGAEGLDRVGRVADLGEAVTARVVGEDRESRRRGAR